MLMLSPQCNFSSYHVSNLYIEKEKVLVQNLLLTSGKLRPSGASLLHVLVPCNKTDKMGDHNPMGASVHTKEQTRQSTDSMGEKLLRLMF